MTEQESKRRLRALAARFVRTAGMEVGPTYHRFHAATLLEAARKMGAITLDEAKEGMAKASDEKDSWWEKALVEAKA